MLGYIRSDSVNPAHTSTDSDELLAVATSSTTIGRSRHGSPSTSACATTTSSPTRRSDDKFVNIEQNGFIVAGITDPKTSQYGRGLIAAGPEQLGPALRLRLPARLRRRSGGPRRLRHLLHAADLQRHLRHGRRRAGHRRRYASSATSPARRTCSSTIRSPARSPPVRSTSPSATTRTCATATSSSGTSTCRRSCPATSCSMSGYVGTQGYPADRHVRGSEPARSSSWTRARRPASLNARRPNQAYQRSVRSDKSIGNSIYHALQLKAERRMSKGLTFLDRLHLVQVDLRPDRHRRPGRRRKLHRRAAGHLRPAAASAPSPAST